MTSSHTIDRINILLRAAEEYQATPVELLLGDKSFLYLVDWLIRQPHVPVGTDQPNKIFDVPFRKDNSLPLTDVQLIAISPGWRLG